MITELTIEKYKSLADVKLSIGDLTLLTGLNGSGKSSVIQSLLLLRQSYEHGMLPGVGLSLNGELVQVGQGQDVLFE